MGPTSRGCGGTEAHLVEVVREVCIKSGIYWVVVEGRDFIFILGKSFVEFDAHIRSV